MIRRIQNFTDKQVFGVLVATAIFSLGFSMWSHLMTGNVNWWAWADGALQNFSTEMMGAIATFALIEVIVGNRNEREKIIINLSSRDSSTALAAWGVAEAKGWLNDGSLRGVNIHGGNLIGAGTLAGDLQGAQLAQVNFESTEFDSTNFNKCHMYRINFKHSFLSAVDFRGAYLRDADFSHAILSHVDFSGANLLGAKFEKTENSLDIVFDIKNILPDGSVWTKDVDIQRFIDNSHPDYMATLVKINTIRLDMGLGKLR